MERVMQENKVEIKRLIEVKEDKNGYVAAIAVNRNRIVYAMASSQQEAVDSLIYKVK